MRALSSFQIQYQIQNMTAINVHEYEIFFAKKVFKFPKFCILKSMIHIKNSIKFYFAFAVKIKVCKISFLEIHFGKKLSALKYLKMLDIESY